MGQPPGVRFSALTIQANCRAPDGRRLLRAAGAFCPDFVFAVVAMCVSSGVV